METIEITDNLTQKADLIKYNYLQLNSIVQRKRYAQFFTPSEIASFLSSLFTIDPNIESIKILDPGAGTGILGVAVVNNLLTSYLKLKDIEIVAIEIDSDLNDHLKMSYDLCKERCKEGGINFSYRIVNEDFIQYGYLKIVNLTDENLFYLRGKPIELFDVIILNPPYKKIDSSSDTRKMLNQIGLETTNLYTAFLLLSSFFLKEDGQIAAITPRSFCNGTYFKSLEKYFLVIFFSQNTHI